jgi:hypothetical protein
MSMFYVRGTSKLMGLGLVGLSLWAGCGSAEEGDAPAEALGQASEELVARPRPLACRSTSECPLGARCTTEDGACNRPPGCKPGDICPAVCYGVCAISPSTPCGTATCSSAEFCCNESCSICAPLDGACTQQFCD